MENRNGFVCSELSDIEWKRPLPQDPSSSSRLNAIVDRAVTKNNTSSDVSISTFKEASAP